MDPKEGFYEELVRDLSNLIGDEPDWLANLSNAAALLYERLDNINWAGFYLMKANELVLGPFQGRPACVRIQVGRGVCGTSVAQDKTQIVLDVHQFPGHIACDQASESEIVVPIHHNGKVVGVLDIDAPIKARFDDQDGIGLEKVVAILERAIAFDEIG